MNNTSSVYRSSQSPQFSGVVHEYVRVVESVRENGQRPGRGPSSSRAA